MDCSNAVAINAAAQTLTVYVASSFSWLSLLTPAVIFLSFCAATAGVLTARSIARQRATLDIIEKTESSLYYRDLQTTFSTIRRKGEFGNLLNPKRKPGIAQRQQVLDFLNHYELISIGILRNTLDPSIYRDWMLGAYLRDWNAASDFIQRERWKWNSEKNEWEYRAKVFENYQILACRWSADAIQSTKDYSPPPTEPAGPGDEHLPGADKQNGTI